MVKIVKYISLLLFSLWPMIALAEKSDENLSNFEQQSYPIKEPLHQEWSFSGPFGLYDRGELRRGWQVYHESCAACHGLQFFRFRDLKTIGFSRSEIETIAKTFQIHGILDENGELTTVPAKIDDYISSPFPNKKVAELANNGVDPPDLSLMAKARAAPSKNLSFLWDIFRNYNEAGPDYIASLLEGYDETPPKTYLSLNGQYYNPYYLSGPSLSMPAPLVDGQIHYEDGTDETVAQYAHDVSAFLAFVADPHMEKRKQIGFCVILFLIAFTFLLYALKKEIFQTIEEPSFDDKN